LRPLDVHSWKSMVKITKDLSKRYYTGIRFDFFFFLLLFLFLFSNLPVVFFFFLHSSIFVLLHTLIKKHQQLFQDEHATENKNNPINDFHWSETVSYKIIFRKRKNYKEQNKNKITATSPRPQPSETHHECTANPDLNALHSHLPSPPLLCSSPS